MLARKKIRCNWRLKREDAVEEVAHLQRLNHAHIIRCVGTYVMGTHLSILPYPATEHNLESFLDEYAGLSRLVDSRDEAWLPMYRDIGNFPICLVQAIDFMHEHLVKHMDIKPTNLLVQEKHHSGAISYKIYLADFGIARSYDTAADAETESSTPFSRTYAAPEVVFQEMRGFPADIFSLGCVVLEIYAALINKRLDFIEVRRRNPNGDISYQANIVPLSHYMERTRRSQFAFPAMAFWMMHEDSRFRPTARELVSSYDVLKPAPCCIAGSESFEAESVPFHKAHAYYSEGKQ
jgi:serine/threonine protein kinase